MIFRDKKGLYGLMTICIMVAMIALFSGCSLGGMGTSSAEKSPDKLQAEYFRAGNLSTEERIDRIMANMSDTQKVGQLVMIGIQGTDVDEDSLYVLNQFHMGGVVLFSRNIESIDQVKALTANLQSKRNDKLPLFIAIDEEGGNVSRLGEIMPENPSEQSLGETGNPASAYAAAEKICDDLKQLGINTNFAPVADIGDYSRSFGTDAAVVSEFVKQAADAYAANNIMYSLKHFPGIGRGRTDSHLDKVVVDASRDELMKSDILPFQNIISTMTQDGNMMMVTHVTYPELGSDLPGTIAKPIITDLLRNELGYDGIVISDDMEMGALAKYYDYREMGVLSILAGADIVMMCHSYEHQQELYMGILDAVRDGRISQERLDESVRRVLRAKLHFAA